MLDHTITKRQLRPNFFLVSQKVSEGTVSPTHYVLLYDNSSMSVDDSQKISYKLTHMYYNWPGAIRVPAPCQYAHKLALLVGEHLHTDRVPEEMADLLYYL